ncbi:MAG TPA: hypothetical protein VNZ45_10605, partial [Bacteroidia bacterium]|nr:hypothetical protein [Bacteroidia bacterium]
MKILPLFGLILFTASCNLSNVNKQFKAILAADSVKKAKDAIHHWTYDSAEDRMTTNKVYYAYLIANQQLSFEPPYQGRAQANIQLSYDKDGHIDYFWLAISKGEFKEPPS